MGTAIHVHAQNVRLRDENEQLREGIKAIRDLINHSSGVAGLHLNGDVADWDSILEGGQYEEWLIAFSDAEAV